MGKYTIRKGLNSLGMLCISFAGETRKRDKKESSGNWQDGPYIIPCAPSDKNDQAPKLQFTRGHLDSLLRNMYPHQEDLVQTNT